MKLNKFHLLGLVLLVIITGSLLSGFVFSLGNKEGVQSLNQGNQEFVKHFLKNRLRLEMLK